MGAIKCRRVLRSTAILYLQEKVIKEKHVNHYDKSLGWSEDKPITEMSNDLLESLLESFIEANFDLYVVDDGSSNIDLNLENLKGLES